jgi:hypothetical protein
VADELGIPLNPDTGDGTIIRPGGPVAHPKPQPLPGQTTPPKPAPLVGTPTEVEPTDTTAMPELSKLAMLLLVLAFIALAKAFTDFLNWLFRTVLGPLWPRTGRKQLDSQTTTQALSNYLGTFAQGIDSEIGVNFTRMAETTGLLGQVVLDAAVALELAVVKIARIEGNAAGVQRGQNALRQSQRQTQKQVAQAQQALQAQNEQHKAEIAELRKRLEQQQHSITHLIEPELNGLKAAIPELQKGATATWGELSKHSEAIGLAGLTAGVAASLARLGASWTRCENNQTIGKAICGSDSNLARKVTKEGVNDLLGLLVTAGILLNFREYVKLEQKLTHTTAEGIQTALRVL